MKALFFVIGFWVGWMGFWGVYTILSPAKSPYTVVDAHRLDDCTYQVGLSDSDGYYFSLTLDLVKFAAMGVNVNDILICGEE